MVWHGYVEHHTINADGRKKDGAELRLHAEPEEVLRSPEEVADWIVRRSAELAKGADEDGRRKNGLMIQHSQAYRGAAARGGSAYATVHVSRTEVIDVCAEITEVEYATTGRGELPG